mmetsp:Transcript_7191/g.23872  ORF Transcript_7191/g.23872 Transcript_7191/m.23872 type:complete len:261 (-) Transcript_7191:261-1043(-)
MTLTDDDASSSSSSSSAAAANVLSPATADFYGQRRGLLLIRVYVPFGNSRGGGDVFNPFEDSLPLVYVPSKQLPLRPCLAPYTVVHEAGTSAIEQVCCGVVILPSDAELQNKFVTLTGVGLVREEILFTGANDYYLVGLIGWPPAEEEENKYAGLVAVITADKAPHIQSDVRYWSLTLADQDSITGNIFPCVPVDGCPSLFLSLNPPSFFLPHIQDVRNGASARGLGVTRRRVRERRSDAALPGCEARCVPGVRPRRLRL